MNQNEAIGIRLVSQIVRERWNCRWQELDARNDDGLDGVIFLRRKSNDIDSHVFAQVKCGAGYRRDVAKRSDHISLSLGRQYLESHIPRWRKWPSPVVLIYVDPTTDRTLPLAWWTDLKSEESYPADALSQVIIPRRQRFFDHSKGDFIRLCGPRATNGELKTIKLRRGDLVSSSFTGTLKQNARKYYQKWSRTPASGRTNPTFGLIEVSRVGWRHICRQRRGTTRIVQSWTLLGAASRIIVEVGSPSMIREVSRQTYAAETTTCHQIGFKAQVVIPKRAPAIVEVIILRRRVLDHRGAIKMSQNWFYSVHEIPIRSCI